MSLRDHLLTYHVLMPKNYEEYNQGRELRFSNGWGFLLSGESPERWPAPSTQPGSLAEPRTRSRTQHLLQEKMQLRMQGRRTGRGRRLTEGLAGVAGRHGRGPRAKAEVTAPPASPAV